MRLMPKKRRTKVVVGIIAMTVFVYAGAVLGYALFQNYSSNNPLGSDDSAGEVKGVVGESTLAKIDLFSDKGLLSASNAERSKISIRDLKLNKVLDKAAMAKCKDMAKRNYWSHKSPEGEEPWTFVKKEGYKYSKLGENLSAGFSDSAAAVTGWINSPEHKKNLLDKAFEEVGFGICESSNYTSAGGGPKVIVVQMLGTPQIQVAPATTSVPKYVPFKCTKTTIPYKTEYVEVSYLYEGETEVGFEGYNGYIEKCTASSTGYKPSDYRLEPINRTVYVGTKTKEQ